MRFRKRLIPYVVAEDENKLIVDVTRRYVGVCAIAFFLQSEGQSCLTSVP